MEEYADRDQVAKRWNLELKENAGEELAAVEAAVRKALDKEKLSAEEKARKAFRLYGEVSKKLDEAMVGDSVDPTTLEQKAEEIEDSDLKDIFGASGKLLVRIQESTSVHPSFIGAYLVEPFFRAAEPPRAES